MLLTLNEIEPIHLFILFSRNRTNLPFHHVCSILPHLSTSTVLLFLRQSEEGLDIKAAASYSAMGLAGSGSAQGVEEVRPRLICLAAAPSFELGGYCTPASIVPTPYGYFSCVVWPKYFALFVSAFDRRETVVFHRLVRALVYQARTLAE